VIVIETTLLCLILIAACVVPVWVYRRLIAQVRNEVSQLTSRIDKNLGASVKLLEVRDYYEQTSRDLKKMLDAAYKEGNRFQQDQIRKMLARLDTLKVRALDKTVGILESETGQPPRKRRRRSRRSRRTPPKAPPTPNSSA